MYHENKKSQSYTPIKSEDGKIDIDYTWNVDNVTIHLVQCYATWEKDGMEFRLRMLKGKIDTLYAKTCTTG